MYQQSAPCVSALSPWLRVLIAAAACPFLASTLLSITILRTCIWLSVCIKNILQNGMTKKYLLIIAGPVINHDSRFVWVGVSSTPSGTKDRDFLTRWAARMGYYFHVYDQLQAVFLERIANSLSMPVYSLPFRIFTAKCLVRLLRSCQQLPDAPEVGRSAANLREKIDPAYYAKSQINVIQRAEAERRNKPKSKVSARKVLLSPLIPMGKASNE